MPPVVAAMATAVRSSTSIGLPLAPTPVAPASRKPPVPRSIFPPPSMIDPDDSKATVSVPLTVSVPFSVMSPPAMLIGSLKV